MKNKKSFLDKMSSGKGFYISTAMSLCTIVIAIFVIYASVSNVTNDYLDFTKPSTVPSTQQAEKNQPSEPDPRLTTQVSTTQPTSPHFTQADDDTTIESTTQAVNNTPVNTSYIMPLDDEVFKEFSDTNLLYSETMGDWRLHSGIDIKADEGSVIVSIGNGTVTKVSANSNWGYIVEIDYGDFIGRYCGLDQTECVSIDTNVKQGDTIGKVASIPCESADGLHLHFEIVKSGSAIDPLSVISK